MNIVEFSNYSFSYALGDVPALKNINLTVNAGEILTLCGASGSGKSTLLRCLKKASAPAGKFSGTISAPDDRDISIVFQDPETQLIMPTVLDDLAFQMENRGNDPYIMKKRMSETVAFFGIEPWLHKNVHTLSGGQKQLAVLSAAIMCEPQLLLLDEPVSQLDPLAGAAFLETVRRLNREFGVTVIIAEHRLDECVAISDRVAFLAEGSLRYAGETENALRFLFENDFRDFVPPLPRASLMINGAETRRPIPLTPKDFKREFPSGEKLSAKISNKLSVAAAQGKKKSVVINDVSFDYPGGHSVIRRLDFSAGAGEIICLLGGNGSGKSTLLKIIAKILKPKLGTVKVSGKIGYMPQNAGDYFSRERVWDEIQGGKTEYAQELAEKLGLLEISDANPFDLSGGERQKFALLAILSRKPDILLLDEPTKGIDPCVKINMGELLGEFKTGGGTVIISTHDMEFAAEFATRCQMLFDGDVIADEPPGEFFADNKYYTTAVHKGLRHIDPSIITFKDVEEVWGLSPSQP